MVSSDLKKYLENPGFTSGRCQSLWEEIRHIEDPFDRSSDQVFPNFTGSYGDLPKISAPVQWPNEMLPIEIFREKPENLFQGAEILTDFHSSGTSSGKKSVSSFSNDGLTLYKASSLLTFFSVLDRLLEKGAKGISLIPPQIVWPTSSLARMVSWIAEFTDVTYTTVENLGNVLEKAGEPVWLFATALHLERCGASAMPASSIVIETGGTKNISKSVNRSELYEGISKKFSIDTSRIISEYGMCELASQAYDWDDQSGERRFRFPVWVDTCVTQGLGVMEKDGSGSLVIYDRARIDYPWPIRTEDMAIINKTEEFKLLGRAPSAPLKGCSLLAKDFLSETDESSEKTGQSKIKGDILKVTGAVRGFLTSQKALDLLAKELGAINPAKSALNDLISGLPTSQDEWKKAINESEAPARIAENRSRWLFILPQNHPIVGLYPLTIAAACGFSLGVRLPKKYQEEGNFLFEFIKTLSTASEITTYDSTFRVNSEMDFDSVLCYGEDETIDLISRSSGLPVRGFGSAIGISIIDFSEIQKYSSQIIKDAFSLGQTGCMATRVLVVTKESGVLQKDMDQISETLTREFQSFWNAPLSLEARVGIDLEEYKYSKQNFWTKRASIDEPLFPSVVAQNHAPLDFNALLSKRPFVLPCIITESNAFDSIDSIVASFTSVKTLTSSDSLLSDRSFQQLLRKKDRRLAPLGQGNAPKWTGLHDGKALFGLK